MRRTLDTCVLGIDEMGEVWTGAVLWGQELTVISMPLSWQKCPTVSYWIDVIFNCCYGILV